jgi:glyoxylase-like metal-dependent hydrolase (beta-lactamase superfamily II)
MRAVFGGLVPLLAVALATRADDGSATFEAPQYTIEAIRYANLNLPVAALLPGAPQDSAIDIAMAVWLIRGQGRSILFDVGFYRPRWFQVPVFKVSDYLRPDSAVALAGVDRGEVTDLIISHAHWDHIGGLDLFPNATVWIQKQEYDYYTRDAWRPGGRNGGIDPDDMEALRRRNAAGKVRLIDGDDVEILPGIRAYTGGRHTFASQYIRVDGEPPFVLASDNAYLYRNLRERRPVATFTPEDAGANVAAQARMIALAGSIERVVPGHDLLQFERFPSRGRIARIR